VGSDDEQAAQEAVDPDRLLEGEDPSSHHRDDVDHWIRVYTELLQYKRDLLSTTRERLAIIEPRAGEEIEKTDLRVLSAEASRFEHRLGFWRRRRSELETNG
jgi:hypothetical protein